ncbi:MFS transporter [Dermatobacter hominis]|uniref:MFS transporter n=1 Tax=Dermatobacter hominis TaxID=2884263 RepID=UPI001D12777B|nr:MFS transporter [Dermatobacter hominis]UDY37415.1 MFS transporter [Dermatobacter hominis]
MSTPAAVAPAGGADDVGRIITARTLRGAADGFVSVLLAQYLTALGLSPVQVGAIVTGTLLGSAALTLTFGLSAHRVPLRRLLLAASVVMVGTGVGFAAASAFWPLLLVAVVGTLNPSAGDVSVFLPTEQAVVAGEVAAARRSRTFARYNLAGTLAGAAGTLASGGPAALAERTGWSELALQRSGFVAYALVGVAVFVVYRGVRSRASATMGSDQGARRRVLHMSRRTVLELAALFSLDSAGSGFVVTSVLVLWLQLRFELQSTTTAVVFAAAGVLGACSQLLAPRLADRIGLVRTMAFTHMPANVLLVLAAASPSGAVAIVALLLRSLCAQMDVPARQAFVMAVVPAEERAAASSVTNVPRSLASAATPILAGWLLSQSTFGWPLVIAGTTKLAYDVVLLVLYRDVPERPGARRGGAS